MDLLSILLACNLYTADEPLVRAIAQSNSHSNTFSVVDPTMDYRDVNVPAEPKTLDAALARLEEVTSKGGKPLLGLMQLPPTWMRMFGREPKDAFDACINVSIGTRHGGPASGARVRRAQVRPGDRHARLRAAHHPRAWGSEADSAGAGAGRRSDRLPGADGPELGTGLHFHALGRLAKSHGRPFWRRPRRQTWR
jgi:hypothetical protein